MGPRIATVFVFLAACGGGGGHGDGGAFDAATQGLPTTCEGDCRNTSVAIDVGSAQADFAVAYFGLTSPSNADSGNWEIYIEASFGGDGLCPTETAPAPDRLLVISGVAIPTTTAVVTLSDGVAVTFLDFEGSFLTGEPLSRATALSVSAVAANPCVECAADGAAPNGERFVSFDITATFAEGQATGQTFATHCDSLDDLL